MPARSTVQLLIGKTDNQTLDSNFAEVSRGLSELSPLANGVETTDQTLAVGDNNIPVPGKIKTPRGRVTTYISAASTLFDKGMVNGKWVVNASAVCTARFLFY